MHATLFWKMIENVFLCDSEHVRMGWGGFPQKYITNTISIEWAETRSSDLNPLKSPSKEYPCITFKTQFEDCISLFPANFWKFKNNFQLMQKVLKILLF